MCLHMLFFYMIASKEEQFIKFIAPINFFLRLSGKAYANYTVNKIFLHAQRIKIANQKVYGLLEESAAFLPEELLPDALELLNHYGIWMAQFEECVKELQPKLGDIFVFRQLDDQSAFPKTAEKHFFEYYKKMKEDLVDNKPVKK